MKRLFACLVMGFPVISMVSCVEAPEKKVVGPATETSKIPWNSQIPGQGQGQFGMLPQNQYRR